MPSLEQTTLRCSHSETSPSRFNAKQESNWLSNYEKRFDSIFRYYSLENEVDFLKKAEELPLSKKEYYVQENVRRFLGEFVGKVPYTTIPYEINRYGFSYAGLPVMDSYRTAARLGGEREKAEIDGFEQIEQKFRKNDEDTSAFWISPPKTADYGFIFVLEKDSGGKVKEYVLRYAEKKDEVKKSAELFSRISPDTPLPENTDSYLRSPLFGKQKNRQENLDAVMRIIGIDEERIASSHMFEQSIDSKLGIWIHKYSEIVCSLSRLNPRSFLYEQGLIEAKKILLSIYQKAEEIKEEQTAQPYVGTYSCKEELLGQETLYERVIILQNNTSSLPKTLGGSCPSIREDNSLDNNFLSNSDMLKSLTEGVTPEQLVKKKGKDFLNCTCPFCNKKVVAKIAEGTITCPDCGKSAPYAC